MLPQSRFGAHGGELDLKNVMTLDRDKVLKNAVTSITLGIEDYQLTLGKDGNPLRAVSAARNLFAGVLLLFKYKISTLADSPEEAALLIYKARKHVPHRSDDGKIVWRPEIEKNKTIDVADIELHFQGLGIETDWSAVRALQKCRNDLEHLHLKHPLEDIKKFLINLYPLLEDFITHQLQVNPASLLGETWEIMLKNHEFFASKKTKIHRQWVELRVPGHAYSLLTSCACNTCGSSLLAPVRRDVERGVPIDNIEFYCECITCGESSSWIELVSETLRLEKEDPYSEDVVITSCDSCGNPLFDMIEGHCHLCGYEQKPQVCTGCHRFLEGHETENGTLCDDCAEHVHFNDEYEPHIN